MHDAFLHPFAVPSRTEGSYRKIVRAEGTRLWDDQGREYLDGMANLWNCQVGHGRAEIVDAVADQMRRLDCYNTFDPFTNGVAVEAAEAIRRHSAHPDGRVFLGCTGSDAVDTALKLARHTHRCGGDDARQVVVTRTRGYHGTNFGGTSLQGIEANRVGWGDLVPWVEETPPDDIEAVSRLFADHGERIAAVVAEPVQGAGGVFPPPDGYLEGLRRLCDDHGALLIFDEVITGFGRVGAWFASARYGVVPDLTTFAKGVTSGYLPLSGVIVSPDVADRLAEPEAMLRTGYTYSGHPVACAAAVANLRIIEDEDLPARAAAIGERLGPALTALRDDGAVVDVRGEGAIWAVELPGEAVPVRDRMLDAGVIARPIGHHLAFCPPLVVSDDEVDRMVDVLVACL